MSSPAPLCSPAGSTLSPHAEALRSVRSKTLEMRPPTCELQLVLGASTMWLRARIARESQLCYSLPALDLVFTVSRFLF